MFQGSFRMCKEHFKVVSRKFHMGVSRLFYEFFQEVSRVFHGNCERISRVFHVACHSSQLPELKEGLFV